MQGPSYKRTLFTFLGVLFFAGKALAASLVPLNAGMQMTCQFVNNTAGQYTNSQIYILAIALNASNQYCHLDASGNMIPCVAGQNAVSYALPLSSFAGLQFPPVMTSAVSRGRIR